MYNQVHQSMHTNTMANNHHCHSPPGWQPNRRRSSHQPRHNRIHYNSSKQRKPYQPLPRFTGILNKFHTKSKYGFIQYHHGQCRRQIFVHQSEFISIPPQIIPEFIGSYLQFDVCTYNDNKTGETRERAQNVRLLDESQQRPTKPPLPQSRHQRSQYRPNRSVRAQYTGIIDFFNQEREFGYVIPDKPIRGINGNVFFHKSALQFDPVLAHNKMCVFFAIEHYLKYGTEPSVKAINIRFDKERQDAMDPAQERLLSIPSPPPRHSRLHYSKANRMATTVQQFRGYLDWFGNDKGKDCKYGFIRCDSADSTKKHFDVFVYETEFLFAKSYIIPGMRLLFEIKDYINKEGKNARKAINVVRDRVAAAHQRADPRETQPATKVILDQHCIEKEHKKQFHPVVEEYKTEQKQKEPPLNVYAAVFVPCVPSVPYQSKSPKFTLHTIPEESGDANDDEVGEEIPTEMVPKVQQTKKKVSALEEMFINADGYKLIARKLYQMYARNRKDYNLDVVFNELYHLDATYRDFRFLSVVLEFLSLIEANESILSVIKHVFEAEICDKYLSEMICIDGMTEAEVFAEFKDYGLQCVYPSNGDRLKKINALMNNNCSVQSFIDAKCYEFVNYQTMFAILEHLIPKYCANKKDNFEIFELIKLMVDNAELRDIDNNNKYIAFTVIISIFGNHNKWTELEEFVWELVYAQIITNDIVEKWQSDDFADKKQAPLALSDVIHELQNREIQENMRVMGYKTETDTESEYSFDSIIDYESYGDHIENSYVDARDLLQTNTNRGIFMN